ncbi:MAG: T9SS type A sorting domain-containing protein [bacterium]|nr:T9SS type A sorting domain-containing protein [bacterium]
MKKHLTNLLLFFALCTLSQQAWAQLNYLPGGFTTATGTYVDLGSNGDTIPLANKDDAFSAPLPIGFSFSFNGAIYDSFTFSTNGFIKLGKDTASRHFLFTAHAQPPPNGPFTSTTLPTPTATDSSILFAFGQDLYPGSNNAEYRYFTTGSPGTQVCTIQWKNVKDKLQATVGGLWDTINFQIKLYEGTNVIEYRYGKWTSTVNLAVARFSAVGIVGKNMTTLNQNLHLVKGSTVVWSGAVANTGFYVNNAVNYRNPTSSPAGPGPDLGRTYTFTPLMLNDAAVRAIYAQGRIALPFHLSDSIRANIVNTGVNTITNLTVTLNITGSNTYTTNAFIASLAPNANVNVAFDPFYPTNLGSNLITVSVPTDDNPANNVKTNGLAISTNRNAYTDTLVPASGGNGTSIAHFWGAKYFINGQALVTQVRSPLASNSDALGDTVCGLVLDSLGRILARSPGYIVQTADLGTTLIFNMSIPAAVSNQTVIVGIAGSNSVNSLNYFLGTSQSENPMRPNTSFYFMSQTAAGGVTNVNTGVIYASPAAWATTRLMMECVVEPIPAVDVGVSTSNPNNNFLIPTNTSIPLRAVVKNFGTQARSSGIQVRYRVNGGAIVGPISTLAGMASGDTSSVLFSGTNSLNVNTPGTYQVKVYTNLSGDGLIGNDTLVLNLTAVAPNNLPYRITNNIMASWTSIGNSPAIWKQKSAPQANGITNANVLYADNIITPVREATMISPPINLVGSTLPIMHFQVAHAPNTFTGTDDTLEVLVSTNGGFSFTPLYSKSSQLSSPTLGTDTPTSSSYTPAFATDWRNETVNLSAFAGNPYVLVAFRDKSASGNGIYIGNISIANASAHSVQSVTFASSFSSGNFGLTFNSIGNTNGELSITRYNTPPASIASPVFATNTSSTTSNSSVFTPNNTSQTHWYVTSYSGMGTGNYYSTIAYTLNIDMTGIPGISSPDSLYIIRRSDYSDSWKTIGSSVSSSNLYTGNIIGFSDFTIGSVSSVNTLPVQWLSFTAQKKDANSNLLNWATASETNSHYYEVQVSKDGFRFEPIGKVKAAGNSQEKQSYSFLHKQVLSVDQTIHYRLKQVDTDGAFTYSKTISIAHDLDRTETKISLSNPFENTPVLWCNQNLEGILNIKVYDQQGKLLIEKSIETQAGYHGYSLNEMSALNQGIYIIEMECNQVKIPSQKIIKLN